MKGIVCKTDGTREVKDFAEPLYKTVGKEVGGWIEIVHPIGLPKPLVIVCNEEGWNLDLPLNVIGSRLYGLPMVGNIVLLKEGWTDEGADIVGLDDKEIKTLEDMLKWVE